MIRRLKTLLQTAFGDETVPGSAVRDQQPDVAVAALLLEVAHADTRIDDSEQQQLLTSLAQKTGLSHEALSALMDHAESRQQTATSLYEFTRTLNDHWTDAQKYRLVQSLWRVAYADGHLDPHEEALIRKVADLIYVPHSDFIRAKLSVVPD